MGHANRSRFDYIVCVDTQPRGVRLSTSRWWGESNADSDRKSYSYTDSYSNSNSNPHSDGYGNLNAQTYSDSETGSYTASAPYAATAAIARVQ